MPMTFKIDPVTRIEGHLGVEITVGDNKVISDAKAIGTQFRGLELILQGRDPRDSAMLMQRICGVCPIGHATGGINALDNAFKVVPTEAGRIIRNLILGSNIVQSHILHFFHLAALDYVKGPEAAPFVPRLDFDFRLSPAENDAAVAAYLEALKMRRLAHEMGAIWAGRMPHTQTIVPGGVTEIPTVQKIADYLYRLEVITKFVNETYIPVVKIVAAKYEDHWNLGVGCQQYLAFGGYPQKCDLDHMKRENYMPPGVILKSGPEVFDYKKVYEDIKYSWYDDSKETKDQRTPDKSVIAANLEKQGAYSYVKAPRYNGSVVEVGPLARQKVKGNADLDKLPNGGASILGRHYARAVECAEMVASLDKWAKELAKYVGQPVCTPSEVPETAEGYGLCEAPRGALGHWIGIEKGRTKVYNAIVPGTWNMSPRDNNNLPGPLEQAFIGMPLQDPSKPVEVVRLVRAYDPCLACAIHVMTPKNKTLAKFVVG